MLHYADQFKFDHGDLAPPFGPGRYIEAIEAAEDQAEASRRPDPDEAYERARDARMEAI